jgi:hypothetical protein
MREFFAAGCRSPSHAANKALSLADSRIELLSFAHYAKADAIPQRWCNLRLPYPQSACGLVVSEPAIIQSRRLGETLQPKGGMIGLWYLHTSVAIEFHKTRYWPGLAPTKFDRALNQSGASKPLKLEPRWLGDGQMSSAFWRNHP